MINPKYFAAVAFEFFNAGLIYAKEYFSKGTPVTQNLFYLITVPAVNISFSMEIALKGLLLHEGKSKPIHDLEVLFDSLSDTNKMKIVNYFISHEPFRFLTNPVLLIVEKGSPTTPLSKPQKMSAEEKVKDIVKRHNKAFIKFRYLFEFENEKLGTQLGFEFEHFSNLTYAVIQVLSKEIGEDIPEIS